MSSRFSRRGSLVAAAALALGFSTIAAPVGADDNDQRSVLAEQQDPRCGPGERALAQAGDRFRQGCLPGNDIAKLDDRGAVLKPGETASSKNVSLIANVPKRGAFAPEDAFNSDLAFQGRYAYAGNYNGFTVYDISKPRSPKHVAQVLCPGSQNDVSVSGDLLILSTDSSRSDDSCESEEQTAERKRSWEGVKVFDISNPAAPKYVAAVETACGSHTHSIASGNNPKNLFVYVSSYSPDESFPDCQPPHDQISVVKVPIAQPSQSRVVSTPDLFPGGGSKGRDYSAETSGCHDITTYPSKDIAAGACMGDGILMDISDRDAPRVTERVRDETNFAFWHSATFNNDGDKVVFTDELGGGGAPTCNRTVGAVKGANGIYDIVDRELVLKSYYKIPRAQSNTENCVAHNGSLIPVEGRDIMVQAWYQGGISVFDFTNSSRPRELGWFDRGPLSDKELVLGGSWSAYWYNGRIYSNDIQQGLDVLRIRGIAERAEGVRLDRLNVQSQPSYNG